MLDIEVNEGLRRRREELRNQLENFALGLPGGTSDDSDIDSRKTELAALSQSVNDLQGKIEETEKEIEAFTKQIGEINARSDELNTLQLESSRGILKAQKAAERYVNKRQTLLQRKEECSKKIRDLGVLPEEAFAKYTDRSQKPEKVSHESGRSNLSKMTEADIVSCVISSSFYCFTKSMKPSKALLTSTRKPSNNTHPSPNNKKP